MSQPVELWPFQSADGLSQMATDELMLTRAAELGRASLRFYTWSVPTLSLGYFQPQADRLEPAREGLPWVRRATGGSALVHHHELTYAFALPGGPTWQPRGVSLICRAHDALRDELLTLGIRTRTVSCGEEARLGPALCFWHQTPGDLILDGHKVAGSAQRKSQGALLQHGGLLLARSPHAPELLGVTDLTGQSIAIPELIARLTARFTLAFGWELVPTPEAVDAARHQAARAKFASSEWANKR